MKSINPYARPIFHHFSLNSSQFKLKLYPKLKNFLAKGRFGDEETKKKDFGRKFS